MKNRLKFLCIALVGALALTSCVPAVASPGAATQLKEVPFNYVVKSPDVTVVNPAPVYQAPVVVPAVPAALVPAAVPAVAKTKVFYLQRFKGMLIAYDISHEYRTASISFGPAHHRFYLPDHPRIVFS